MSRMTSITRKSASHDFQDSDSGFDISTKDLKWTTPHFWHAAHPIAWPMGCSVLLPGHITLTIPRAKNLHPAWVASILLEHSVFQFSWFVVSRCSRNKRLGVQGGTAGADPGLKPRALA